MRKIMNRLSLIALGWNMYHFFSIKKYCNGQNRDHSKLVGMRGLILVASGQPTHFAQRAKCGGEQGICSWVKTQSSLNRSKQQQTTIIINNFQRNLCSELLSIVAEND
jgi:hypothetical protein